MVKSKEQAMKIQERRVVNGKDSIAKAVRRWMKREGVKTLDPHGSTN